MSSSTARKTKGERAESALFEDVTNPFCGLLPDDLVVERTEEGLKVLKNGAASRSRASSASCRRRAHRSAARMFDLDKAIKQAAKLHRQGQATRSMAGLPPMSKACAQ